MAERLESWWSFNLVPSAQTQILFTRTFQLFCTSLKNFAAQLLIIKWWPLQKINFNKAEEGSIKQNTLTTRVSLDSLLIQAIQHPSSYQKSSQQLSAWVPSQPVISIDFVHWVHWGFFLEVQESSNCIQHLDPDSYHVVNTKCSDRRTARKSE